MAKLLTRRADKVCLDSLLPAEDRQRNEMIAAIDFGTASTSLTFTLRKTDQIRTIKLNPGQERVPTAILLRKVVNEDLDEDIGIEEFGSTAQDTVTNLAPQELEEYLYFELFKMELRSDVSGDSLVPSLVPRPKFFAQTVDGRATDRTKRGPDYYSQGY